MSGILFFKTHMLEELKIFYTDEIGCSIWLEQADCVIFKHGNLLIGFCDREEVDTGGMITFFFDSRETVDIFYRRLSDIAVSAPVENDKYNIYQFFAKDPEGRTLEFQYFNDPMNEYYDGGELLKTRRSIRKFRPDEIPDHIIRQVLDNCRFAPTSMNTQSYYFRIIKNREIIEWLADLRGSSSAPIARAPIAVAICADPALTKRPEQDGCIAAYHFLLAAWNLGLGTCWIAAMNRDDVKDMLKIPLDHYIATITPLGYPEKLPVRTPSRKELDWFIRE